MRQLTLDEVMKRVEEMKNENANVSFSNNFVELQFQAELQRMVAEKDIGNDLMKRHDDGDLHIHDLGFWLRPNCLQHPIYMVLRDGLKALECISSPAKHLDTALSHCVNVISMGQSHMAGGQAITMFDVWLSPFVRNVKDGKEFEQNLQQFIYQINQISPSRGLQSAFSSVVFVDEIPKSVKNMNVGYREIDGVYDDYNDERIEFIRMYMKVLNKGDAIGKPFMFPNTIFYIRNENVYDDELKEMIIYNMLEKGNVYFLNGFKYGNELASAMGCLLGCHCVKVSCYGEELIIKLENLFYILAEIFGVEYYGKSTVVDLVNCGIEIKIWDSKKGWVKLKRIIMNPDLGNWYRIVLEDGHEIIATGDHPFPLYGGDCIRKACALKVGDELIRIVDGKEYPVKIVEVEFLGRINSVSYDVETESGFFEIIDCGIYSHNCRTYLDDVKGNMFDYIFGTGNLNYITLNIPRAVLMSNGDLDKFYNILDGMVDDAIKILLLKRKRIWKCWYEGWYPFFYEYCDDGKYYYDIGFTTMSLGIIGFSDCEKIMNYFGTEFPSLEIIKYLRNRVDELNKYEYYELAKEMGIEYPEGLDEVSRWSLFGSPAESCSYRFKMKDNKLFGKILKDVGIYDRKYYVNSIMVDEDENITAIEKILRESKFHEYLNGGIICHLWNAVSFNEIDPLELWDWFMKILKKTSVRYLTVSNVIVNCKNCNKSYVGNKNELKCKFCGSENIELYTKITGYLSPVKRWNDGKKDEFMRRNRFVI